MRLWIFITFLALSGCQVGPRYQYPEISVANSWKNQESGISEPKVECWWQIFQDQKLTVLIEQAIGNNPSLLAALERIEEARGIAGVAKSKLFPQLNFDPAASNRAQRAHSFGSTLRPPPTLVQDHIDKYILPLTLLYEFDFWDKWRGQYKSARFLVEAEIEAYQTSLLLMTTDLANAYFQIRIQDAQIDLFRKILSTRQTALEIQRSRYDANLVGYIDVTSYQTDYSTVEAQYFDALKTRAIFENQIAVLVGSSPSTFKIEPMPLEALPPVIPAATPANVLLRRPDLAEQERKMAAIHSEINVAYSSYFPSIDLSAIFDFLSQDFSNITSKFISSIGSNLTEILFDGWGRSSNVDAIKAKFDAAAATYQEKILTAFQEVEDSLASIHWIGNEMEAINTAYSAAEIAFQIARDRYAFGLSSYLGAADNERTALTQKMAYLELLKLKYLHTIHLIKAIGGGWESVCG